MAVRRPWRRSSRAALPFKSGVRILSLRALALAAFVLVAGAGASGAEPVSVRLPEGNARGFLVLRSSAGAPLAYGELIQKPARDGLESRLVLHFKDGSLYDEILTFSQKGVFRLERYHLVQRGPSYPPTDVSFDRRTGRYKARIQDKKGDPEKTAGGALEMPADLYNGMALTLIKNLPAGHRASGQLVAFTPEPRLLRMEVGPEGTDKARVSGGTRDVTRFLVKLDIGGLTGVVASMIGKEPPDLRYWLVPGEVPAFARFEGAMYLNGPLWSLEMQPVEWSR
jgi:hypothetical protein